MRHRSFEGGTEMGLYVLALASVFAHVIAASPVMVEASDVETIDAEQKKLAEYVLSGYRHGRSLLRTGEFRYTGIRMHKSEARGIDRSNEIEGFMAFDFDRNWLRFDREETVGDAKPRGGQWIQKGDEMVVQRYPWTRDTAMIKPASPPKHQVLLGVFDIRTVGFLSEPEFEFRGVIGVEETLARLEKLRLVEAVRDDGLYRLSWKDVEFSMVSSVWFDEKRGFGITRKEVRPASSIDDPPMYGCDASWLEREGVWVPETLSMTVWRPTSEDHTTYAFQWKSVNGVVDDKLFSIDAFQKPGEEGRIVDFRSGKPIRLYDPAARPEPVVRRWTLGRVLLMTVSGVLVLGGLVLSALAAARRRSR